MNDRSECRGLISGVALGLAVLLYGGCADSGDRPDLGTVTGTVRLDGEPVVGAGVSFQPRGLRPSLGYTDEEGHYELIYLRDIKGAAVGTHDVRIDRLPRREGESVKRLPARYNRQTELTREVEAGSNVIDFDLTSGEGPNPGGE